MELTGIIEEIFAPKTISEKFTVREFVLKVASGKYFDLILFQCINDNTEFLDDKIDGDKVTVYFSIGGRKSKDRYYNSLKVSGIALHGNKFADETTPTKLQQETTEELHKNQDDLPF